MRESKKTERMHLPRGAMEEWLEGQAPKPEKARRRGVPPEDVYEAWVRKRVGTVFRRKGVAA